MSMRNRQFTSGELLKHFEHLKNKTETSQRIKGRDMMLDEVNKIEEKATSN
jgi:hypothetical protein